MTLYIILCKRHTKPYLLLSEGLAETLPLSWLYYTTYTPHNLHCRCRYLLSPLLSLSLHLAVSNSGQCGLPYSHRPKGVEGCTRDTHPYRHVTEGWSLAGHVTCARIGIAFFGQTPGSFNIDKKYVIIIVKKPKLTN